MNNITRTTSIERFLLQHLLIIDSASVYEIQKIGVSNPSLVVSLLRAKGFVIETYYEATHEVNSQIVYGHYRYKLLIGKTLKKIKEDVWAAVNCLGKEHK